jgi:hypothetical protein
MAELESQTAIVAAPEGYAIKIRELSPSGKAEEMSIPVPANVNAHDLDLMLEAAVLKRTTWRQFEFPTILHACIYARRMGLDITAGDVYMAEEGRLSTTAGAKIRHAMSTGKIQGYEVEITKGPEIEIPWETAKSKGSYKGPNYHVKVVVTVLGWQRPVVYETDLVEWFVGRNPNWRTRPLYMLRRNALSKALEEVAPLGVEAEEAPPVT